jgi:hypothetical protein
MLFGDTVTSAAAIGIVLVVVAGLRATLIRATTDRADARTNKDATSTDRSVPRRKAA